MLFSSNESSLNVSQPVFQNERATQPIKIAFMLLTPCQANLTYYFKHPVEVRLLVYR